MSAKRRISAGATALLRELDFSVVTGKRAKEVKANWDEFYMQAEVTAVSPEHSWSDFRNVLRVLAKLK